VIPDHTPDIFQPGNDGLYAEETLFSDGNGPEVPVGADGVRTMTVAVPIVPQGPSMVRGWCGPRGFRSIWLEEAAQILHRTPTSASTPTEAKTSRTLRLARSAVAVVSSHRRTWRRAYTA
jgi:hypothetical protein